MKRVLRLKAYIILMMVFCLTVPMRAEALPTIIHQTVETEALSSGTTHEHMRRFTSKGWFNIHVVKIDLNKETQVPVALFGSDGISVRQAVNDMMDKSPKVVAAVNGDYFNYKPDSSSLGVMVSEGKLISSPPHKDYAMPAFYMDSQRQGHVGFLDRNLTATNNRTGRAQLINMVNKISADYATIALLDDCWGKTSPGNSIRQDIREVVVVGNQVIEVRDNLPGVAIPANGYILAAKKEVLQDFVPGDTLTLVRDIVPGTEQIPFALGGGSIILKDGEPTLTNINSEGTHPRTGVGISQDGKQMLLVTVDGRNKFFKGIGQKEFGELMKDLGAWNALNLDGGGSTTMAISPRDQSGAKVVNLPSDGKARLVVNALGIRSDDPVGPLHYLKISATQKGVHQGGSVALQVQGYDANHHVVEFDRTALAIGVEGVEGSVNASIFRPTTAGKAVLTAKVGEVTGTMTMPVYGPVASLETDASYMLQPGEKKTISVKAVDALGYEAPVSPENLSFVAQGDIGTMEGNTLIAGQAGAHGYVSISHGEVVRHIPVTVGTLREALVDFEESESYGSSAWPQGAVASVAKAPEQHSGQGAIAIHYDFTKVEGPKAAYVHLPESVGVISEKAQEIEVAVKADGKGAGLKATIVDAAGKEHVVVFAPTIKQTRWQTLPVKLPEDIAYPARITNLYLAEGQGDKVIEGTVLLDTLTYTKAPKIMTDNVPESTITVDPLRMPGDPVTHESLVVTIEPSGLVKAKGDQGVIDSWNILNQHQHILMLRGITDAYGRGVTKPVWAGNIDGLHQLQGADVITVKMKATGILAQGTEPWIQMKNAIENSQASTLVLALPHGLSGFTDAMERDLVLELLSHKAEEGKHVFLVNPGSSSGATVRDGVHIITLGGGDASTAEKASTWRALQLTFPEGSAPTFDLLGL